MSQRLLFLRAIIIDKGIKEKNVNYVIDVLKIKLLLNNNKFFIQPNKLIVLIENKNIYQCHKLGNNDIDDIDDFIVINKSVSISLEDLKSKICNNNLDNETYSNLIKILNNYPVQDIVIKIIDNN